MAVLKGKADKVVKILLMIWVMLSGILCAIVGVVHFVEHKWLTYHAPKGLESQGSFALSFQAVLCVVFGIIFALIPFSSLLRKIKCIKKITFAYNRVTLLFFYAIGGFIVFSMCGIFGLVVACLFWLSFIIVFLLLFLTTSISKFASSSSSVEMKKKSSSSSD